MTATEIARTEPSTDEATTHVLCCRRVAGDAAICGQTVDTHHDGVAEHWCVLCVTIVDAAEPHVCPHDGLYCPGVP